MDFSFSEIEYDFVGKNNSLFETCVRANKQEMVKFLFSRNDPDMSPLMALKYEPGREMRRFVMSQIAPVTGLVDLEKFAQNLLQLESKLVSEKTRFQIYSAEDMRQIAWLFGGDQDWFLKEGIYRQ